MSLRTFLSDRLNQSIYPVFVVFFFLFFLLFVPHVAKAAELCGQPALTAQGYFFNQYESVSYDASGYLVYHFTVQQPYTDGRIFTLGWQFVDDLCEPGDLNTFSTRLSLPQGASAWSVRFSSPTHFDVWDDTNNAIILSQDTDVYPAYTKIVFSGVIDGGVSTFTSQTVPRIANATAPRKQDTLPTPASCASFYANGNFFDQRYERAEYVDGLLRIHLRAQSKYSTGSSLESTGFALDGACTPVGFNPFAVPRQNTYIPRHLTYYSFRMITPTHWELWDDERDVHLDCGGCQGDVPEQTPFVAWYARFGSTDMTLTTTPFAPTGVRGCVSNCNSSILFIPGFEASRLYTKTNGTENQLWEPGIFSLQGDAKKLYLDASGKSINQVYTKATGAIDSIDIPLKEDLEVYGTFLNHLSDMQQAGTIAAFATFPYDWRMSALDVVEKGTQYEDGTHYIEDAVVALAKTSKSGKVTIVGHSNGGLVAKALMQKLEKDGKANLVDKVILVAVPQLGTPKAVASLLNGDFQDFPSIGGFIVSKSTARELGRNMPGALGLLPSSAYFAKVATPVVSLTEAPTLMKAAGITDSTIDDFSPFKKFITDSTGRQSVSVSDVETPITLSPSLFADADALHTSLDSWTSPSGVQVIQIVGTGLATPSGVTYSEYKTTTCQTVLTCVETSAVRHLVDMTLDGDETVQLASAVGEKDAATYYFDIGSFNSDFDSNYKHSSLMGASPVGELVNTIISSSTLERLPSYISTSSPIFSKNSKRLFLRMLSPVAIDAYDALGRHTGLLLNPSSTATDLTLTEENIPNSYYEEFGEGKYIGLPAGGNFTVILKGLDSGTFTFEAIETNASGAVQKISYKDIPVTASSTGEFVIQNGTVASSSLSIDVNGDGKKDTLPGATSATSPAIYVQFMKESITSLAIGSQTKKQLLVKISNLEQLIKRSDLWDDTDEDGREIPLKKEEKIKDRIVRKIGKIDAYVRKQLAKSADKKPKKEDLITQKDATQMLNMLAQLKTLVQ